MLAFTGPRVRRTADAVVHRRPIGRDPAKSAAARVGGFARAQRLTPARRQEIGRIACNAGLAALAPRFAEAARRLEANVAELELAIKDAAKNGQRFSAAKYIDLQDWPNEGKVHARFKEKHGLSCRAFYEVCARDAWRPQ